MIGNPDGRRNYKRFSNEASQWKNPFVGVPPLETKYPNGEAETEPAENKFENKFLNRNPNKMTKSTTRHSP